MVAENDKNQHIFIIIYTENSFSLKFKSQSLTRHADKGEPIRQDIPRK